jgi:hypothetical protein
MKTPFNKFLYLGFIVLGAYQAIFTKDFVQAASSLGIGLAFGKRPFYSFTWA